MLAAYQFDAEGICDTLHALVQPLVRAQPDIRWHIVERSALFADQLSWHDEAPNTYVEAQRPCAVDEDDLSCASADQELEVRGRVRSRLGRSIDSHPIGGWRPVMAIPLLPVIVYGGGAFVHCLAHGIEQPAVPVVGEQDLRGHLDTSGPILPFPEPGPIDLGPDHYVVTWVKPVHTPACYRSTWVA